MAKTQEVATTNEGSKLPSKVSPEINAALATLKAAKVVKDLTADSIELSEWEEGEERRYIFTGMGKAKSQYGPDLVDAVFLLDEEGNAIMTMNTVFVGSCMTLDKYKGIAVMYEGRKQGKKNTYAKFRIQELDLVLQR